MTVDINTKDLLLDAAEELCQKRGYNGFSFRDLASMTGIKSASVHYHFPTKGDLGVAMMQRYTKNFTAELSCLSESPTEEAKLRGLSDLLKEILLNDQRMCLCGMLATDFETLPSIVRTEVKMFLTAAQNWIAERLAAGKRTGEFNFTGSPEVLAVTFFGSLQGMMLCARTDGNSSMFSKGVKQLISLLKPEMPNRETQI